MIARLILVAALLSALVPALFWPGAAPAQSTPPPKPPPAVLVADSVSIGRDGRLTARGNVEVFQGDTRLTAQAVIFDDATDTLTIEGPIRLEDGDDLLFLASAAELDAGLRTGILRSARLVLDQQLQMAALQINRVDDRYSQLYKSTVSSCHVCGNGRPPLWQIRAERIVHDREERQIYITNAQLRVRDVPVFYIPQLRLPDPTLKRATGFLIPSIRSTSQLGNGIKIPYFIRLGDHRDLTLTPYLSPRTRTLELRYRQAFQRGRVNFNGAIARDDILSGEDRHYVFADGQFDLGNDFRLAMDLELASDDAFLKQYGYSDKDRLDSAIGVSRVKRDEFFSSGLIGYRTLRVGEQQSTLPAIVFDAEYERRLFPAAMGGELRLSLDAHTHLRESSDGLNGAGRDTLRLHGAAMWLRQAHLGGGVVAQARAGLTYDIFDTREDDLFAGTETRIVPQAALALRYPLVRQAANGARLFLEPVVQLSWTKADDLNLPNEESNRVEFDEGNLLSLSRFPEPDRREDGTVIAAGLNWARYDPAGWETFLTLGQILRDDALGDVSRSSGLQSDRSDLLVAAQFRSQTGLALTGRALVNSSFDVAKAEIRGDWTRNDVSLGGSYLWLTEDAAEDRARDVSEVSLEGAYRINQNWRIRGNWRFDTDDSRFARAGLGLGYDNECVAVDISFQRIAGSSSTVEPSTNFGFTISLKGFSSPASRESYTPSCS